MTFFTTLMQFAVQAKHEHSEGLWVLAVPNAAFKYFCPECKAYTFSQAVHSSHSSECSGYIPEPPYKFTDKGILLWLLVGKYELH